MLTCGADEARQELFATFPDRALRQNALDQALALRLRNKKFPQADGQGPVYTVPVVVHIVHNGGAENIPDAQVVAAIQHLNDAYAHTGYFNEAGPGVDMGIRFCLAHRTPSGQYTTGITRTQSPLTVMTRELDDLSLKNLVRWDPERYVNIWVVGSITSLSSGPGVAGYAYFPSSHGQPEDGMVCEAQFFGADPASDAVLIHEMGHYFGLYHTFEGGCKNDDCLADGDRVCDTPPDQARHTACPFNSCSTDTDAPAPNNPFTSDVDDMTENFMDYSPFECYYRFTQGQADRAHQFLETTRKSLLDSDVCLDPCIPAPVAAFSVSPGNGTAGVPVAFTNLSTGAATYQWWINDMPFSAVVNPVYTFNTPGQYLLKLIITGNDANCVDSFSLSYQVICQVTVGFTASQTEVDPGVMVAFTGSGTAATSFTWYVNGIAVGNGINLNYAFPSPGVYTVVLVASNGVCEKQYEGQIKVKSKCPCPEICDNGIDDDQDGYVDCYDSDCHCFGGADCSIVPPQNNFSMKTAWRSASPYIPGMSIPIVANLDPAKNDMPEIIVSVGESGKYPKSYKLFIYQGDGSNTANPDVLPILKGFTTYSHIPPVAGDIDHDGSTELILTELDGYIRVYHDFQPGKNPAMSLWITSNVVAGSTSFRPMLADMDGDGTPEVIAGNEIFQFDFSNPAVPMLKKVLDGNNGPTGRAVYANYLWQSTGPVAADVLTPNDCGGDPDCNGLELVAGTVIYSVDLDPNDGDGYQIKIQRDLNQMTPGFTYGEGYTAVADLDLDGTPDIAVTGRRKTGNATTQVSGLFVWNKNGLITFMPYPVATQYCGSFPTIANVYDDTQAGYTKDYPEIIVTSASLLNCFNLHLTPGAPTFASWWNLPTTDLSGNTGCTVFDFNGDGLLEIVYRDQDYLRIVYGGPAPFPTGVDNERNWSRSGVRSATMEEFPVIADLDNDGQAEIAVTGVPPNGSNYSYGGYLNVFETAGAPWMPCRPMWNQFNYNIVNVNDDLRIPAHPQQQWKEFPGPGGGKYPLNMNLAQLPSLNDDYKPGYPVPDAYVYVDSVFCEQTKLGLRVTVCNGGSSNLPANIPLQFYSADPTAGPASKLGLPVLLPQVVAIDSCLSWTIKINMPPAGTTLWGVINDNGSMATPFNLAADFPSTSLPECDFSNNLFSLPVSYSIQAPNLGPNKTLCNSSTEVLHAGPGFVQYRWQDGSVDSTFTAADAGKYWVDVWDICGNKYTDSITITLQNIPGFELGPDRVICAGDSLKFSIPGYAALTWSPVAAVNCTDCPAVSLLPDTSLVLRATGQAGVCLVSDSVRITVIPVPVVESAQIEEPPCGRSDGAILLTASGGAGPFTFDWSNLATGAHIAGLAAGSYSVTITNAAGCRSEETLVIPAVDTLAWTSALPTPVTCFAGNDGAIDVDLGGGTLPYAYNWSNFVAGAHIAGLPAGTYTVTATDAHGCTIVQTLNLTEPEPLTLSGEIDPTSCIDTTGNIALTASGGTPGYAFAWDHGPTDQNLTGLPPGDYSVEITDANGCTASRSFTITPGGSPAVAASVLTPVGCFGGKDGAVAVDIAGGVAPYQYDWTTGPGGNTVAGLPAGNYALTVTDVHGCSTTAGFVVPEPLPLSVNSVLIPTNCTDTTASIAVTGTGGVLPYSYAWDGGQVTPARTGLSPGIYTVVVTDANGCSVEQMFALAPGGSPKVVDAVLTPVACFGGKTGQIAVTLAGGVSPYQYVWSVGPGNNVLGNLSAGAYALTASDANGCTVTEQFDVAEPPALLLSASIDSTTCANTTANITASGSGGTSPYGYHWSNGADTPALTGLLPGLYTVQLTDAHGCTAVQSYTLFPGRSPVLSSSQVTPVRCFGQNNGQIAVGITSGRPPYTFLWSAGPGINLLPDVLAGNYTLTVSDAIGCSLTAAFSVPEPPLLDVALLAAADTCGQKTGALHANPAGGVPPYQFVWSNNQAKPDLVGLAAGPWLLTVTDANGCTVVQQAAVQTVEITPVFTLTGDTITCAHPAAKAAPAPAPANWVFVWKTPYGALLNGAQQVLNSGGDYAVTATNNFGCTAVQTLSILVDTLHPAAVAAAGELILPCDLPTISLDGSGSSAGPYILTHWFLRAAGQTVWDTLARVAQAGQAGAYVLQVTDARNGCIAYDTTLVATADRIDAAFFFTDSVSCYGLSDGAIRVEGVDGGTAPYAYSIDKVHFSTDFMFAHLPAGTYPLSVRDSLGCLWQGLVPVGQPDSLSVSLVVSDTLVTQGETVLLKALVKPPNAALSVIGWTPLELFPSQAKLTQTVRPEAPTLFGIFIQTANGCMAAADADVRVIRKNIYLPNALQPDSPGNHAFTVFGGTDVRLVRLMRIYDRWGELLFERKGFAPNDPELGWDGTYRGQTVGPGVYVFHLVVEMADDTSVELTGNVTVVR